MLSDFDAATLPELKQYVARVLALEVWYSREQFEEIELIRLADPLYALLDEMRIRDFIYDFDWISWGKEAEKLIDKPELLEKADLNTLQRLMTAHSRNESLRDGHLAEMIDSGHLRLLFQRIMTL